MSRGRAHTTITAEGATHTRFASSDDESLDDVNSPATVEEDEAQPCFLEALPDAILQHTLAFTTSASVVRAAASAKRLLRACQAPSLWSALGRAAFQRHDCARPFPANWDVAGRSLAPWLRASFPKSWPRSMRPPPPPRALSTGRRDDRPQTRDLSPLGQTACEYLTALDGTGYDVCVRSDAPFDVRAPRGAGLVVPHNNGWACVGGAYFEVSIASGRTRVPGVTPCVAVGVCQRAFKLRGKQPGWTRSSWAYHGDDGNAYHGSGVSGVRYGPRFGAGDVVGCGLCRANDENLLAVYFVLTRRDKAPQPLGVAYLIDGAGPLYAVVGMDSPALSVTVNFGAEAPLKLPDEQRRHLETVLCRGSAWGRGYPPGMTPEGDSSDDSDGDFDEGDTSDEESLVGLFVDQGVN
ncbi:unnamed protein product [Pelagomonas calceolata]|uniref:B30.2/SPRY domain-containing protein n=2 Tax=Pelagomonas calceolata TaxID=35677 RepID=A0A8J2T327_9STRA|nr:unnamed protein product [Pelagomonas calceolata]